MKKLFRLLLCASCAAFLLCVLLAGTGRAQQTAPPIPPQDILGETTSEWLGVHYQVLILKRIPPNRLLVVLQLSALRGTPDTGTSIFSAPPVVPGMTAAQLGLQPFSFASSVMTNVLSGAPYPVLPSVAPLHKVYRPNTVFTKLMPGRRELVDMQFACPPPPPPPAPGQPPKKQMLSFIFPKGLTPVVIELPPPDKSAVGATPAGGG